MQVVVPQETKFEPVKLELVLETQDEVDALYAIMNTLPVIEAVREHADFHSLVAGLRPLLSSNKTVGHGIYYELRQFFAKKLGAR